MTIRDRLRAPALTALALALALGLAPGCGSTEDEEEETTASEPAGAAEPAETAGEESAPGAAAGAAGAEGLPQAPEAPDVLPRGLLVAVSTFEEGPDGNPVPHSELLTLVRRGGSWEPRRYEDPESNVFHKAMVVTPPEGGPGVLTLGGSAAAVKLWRPQEGELAPVATWWQEDFGGKFSRMRDAESADLDGDGEDELAVATHDQGVVAVVDPRAGGEAEVTRLDEAPDTFIHEIEIGDLDGDGTLEVYATPSDPNKLDGELQKGKVVRYVPAAGGEGAQVAELGDRHAKEILVEDVDGDGSDELYVSVEAAEGGSLRILRYEADTDPSEGAVIATLDDPMCRFLTAGDVDGDGAKELVAAAKDTGLWLLEPGEDPQGRWEVSRIDADSRGFEHAALLADLDEDGVDELYVASDDDREIRRYVWGEDGPMRRVIHRRTDARPILTWNLMAAPSELLP